jgi:hypothetical protein
MYDGPKYMLGIWTTVKLDPDLYKHIWNLERTMAVRDMNLSVLQYKNPDLNLWMRYLYGL